MNMNGVDFCRKKFTWKKNLDIGKQMFNNLANMNSQPSMDAVWMGLPSHEYENVIQQEACYPQAWDLLSSTSTPASRTIDLADPPALCNSDMQSAQRDLLLASGMTYNMLLTGSSANKLGEMGDVLSPVSVSHVPKEIVGSPEPFSSVTVGSGGEWNANKEPYENGLMHSDSSLLCISDSVSESSIKPQYSDEVEFNVRSYRGYVESNQNLCYQALHGSHLNCRTSEPDFQWFSEDNTLPTALSYQMSNLPPSKRKRVENLPMLDFETFSSQNEDNEGPIGSKKIKTDPNRVDESFNDCEQHKTEHSCSCGTKKSEIENSSEMSLDTSSFLPTEQPTSDQREKIQEAFQYNQTTSAVTSDLTVPKDDDQMRMRSEDPKRLLGVSLTDFFTIEQLKCHIHSLSQYNQGSTRNMTLNSTSENICQLCHADKLVFAPPHIYCSLCCVSIRRSLVYYWVVDEASARHCFCTKCFKKSPGDSVSFQGLTISKDKFLKSKNIEQYEESWVECGKCGCWQHQICALYNGKKDLEGQAKYTCPFCCLREIEIGEHVPLTSSFRAQDLPRSMLSDHIEHRLFSRLKSERNERAQFSGQDVDEVPSTTDLVVRVVLSVNKKLMVKQQFLDLFHNEQYPSEFQYRSKVILLFQKIEGVDVCLFGMYVQEFGSKCAPPNKRCVYISYLDSIKYFRPEIETAKGEALRTFVYHEILIGYLDYCKQRGFTTCYLWACPPVKGEDYILYCHPESQKTPKPDKLRMWYRSMLRKASEEGIVMSYTNLYDQFFVPSARNNSRITAASLPYFDGDYWSGTAEDLIKNIEKERRGDSSHKVKKLVTKTTLKAIGYDNVSADVAKDILVMQKLGQIISPVKEDFVIVNLHVICTNCDEAILSGSQWFCDQCRNFHICSRCIALKKNLGEQKIHTSVDGEKHLLSEVVVGNIPAHTEDRDSIINDDFFENRHSFLSFCQENHYQFDTLRRAKHSSMMILYHLFKKIHLSKTDSGYGSGQSDGQQGLQVMLLTLKHASECHSTQNNPCSKSGCLKMKRVFQHVCRCNVKASGGCGLCNKAWNLLSSHALICHDLSCRVPRCRDIKEHRAKNSLLRSVYSSQVYSHFGN